MNAKIIVLIILSFLAGISFIAAGIYFLSKKDPRAKGTAFVSLALGALTIVFASMIIAFPTIAAPLALTYMIFLIFAFLALVIIYR